MILLGPFGVGIAVGASLQALVLGLLVGPRDAPSSPLPQWQVDRGTGGGEIWKLHD